jgi:hypothetical protein
MDIEDASGLICDTFDKWMISEDINLFKEYNVIQALNICLDDCIDAGGDCPAFYDYAKTNDEIYEALHYISDRWNCTGRIRFILRVIGE